jgi:hypothetical protein
MNDLIIKLYGGNKYLIIFNNVFIYLLTNNITSLSLIEVIPMNHFTYKSVTMKILIKKNNKKLIYKSYLIEFKKYY